MTGIARLSTREAGFEAKLAKLLVFESTLLHFYTRCFFCFIVIIITCVEMQFLLVHFCNLIHHTIEEKFIMANNNHAAFVVL